MTETNPYLTPEASLETSSVGQISTPTFLQLFTVQGRLRRSSYMFYYGIVAFLALIVFGTGIVLSTQFETLNSALPFIGGLLYIVLIWVFISLGVRRLHDLGKSGWLLLVMIIPLISTLFAIWMIFAKGNESSNFYGDPNPKNKLHFIVAIAFCSIPLIGIAAAIIIPQLYS